MECNKDEAIRTYELAEKKFTEMDFRGARKFILKAQRLYPQLTGISQFLEVTNLHLTSENKINGEYDWYGILGVDPSASVDLIKKQYRIKSLALHPDKNKSVGADGAFKLISAALQVLSDEEKRKEYHKNINIRTSYQRVFTGNPETPADIRGSFNFFASANIKTPVYQNIPTSTEAQEVPRASYHIQSTKQTPDHFEIPKTTPTVTPKVTLQTPQQNFQSASRSCPPRRLTFWTCCKWCKLDCLYRIIFLRSKVICCHCRGLFVATELPLGEQLVLDACAEHMSHKKKRGRSAGSHGPRSTRVSGPAATQTGPGETGELPPEGGFKRGRGESTNERAESSSERQRKCLVEMKKMQMGAAQEEIRRHLDMWKVSKSNSSRMK